MIVSSVAVTRDEDGRLDVGGNGRRRPGLQPRGELGPGLQQRVHRRLRGESLVHGGQRCPPQVDGECGRGERVLTDVHQHDVEPRVVGSDDDVAHVVGFGGSRPSGRPHADDDDGVGSW